jgi:hypothetical protein
MYYSSKNLLISFLDYEESLQIGAEKIVTDRYGKRLTLLYYKKLHGIFKTKIWQWILVTVGQYSTDFEFGWTSFIIASKPIDRYKQDDKVILNIDIIVTAVGRNWEKYRTGEGNCLYKSDVFIAPKWWNAYLLRAKPQL